VVHESQRHIFNITELSNAEHAIEDREQLPTNESMMLTPLKTMSRAQKSLAHLGSETRKQEAERS